MPELTCPHCHKPVPVPYGASDKRKAYRAAWARRKRAEAAVRHARCLQGKFGGHIATPGFECAECGWQSRAKLTPRQRAELAIRNLPHARYDGEEEAQSE